MSIDKAAWMLAKINKTDVSNTSRKTSVLSSSATESRKNNLDEIATTLKGFQGNSGAYAILPAVLNGVYDVEFLHKAAVLDVSRRLLDFRDGGGTGFITINASNVFGQSSGATYVDRIATASVPDTELHLLEVRGITIVSTQIRLLAETNQTTGNNASFVSRIRIFEHYTGELIAEWMLDETSGTALWENTGRFADGTIYKTYAGVFGSLAVSKILKSYRYVAHSLTRTSSPDIMITHDDGNVEMKTIVAPLLQTKGMIANSCIVKDWVEGVDAKYMRLADLAELKNTYGWGIVNHTTSHQNLATLYNTDPALAEAEIKTCQDWLNANGFEGDALVYAQSNSYSPRVGALAKTLGIKIGRRPFVATPALQEYPPSNFVALVPISINDLNTGANLQVALRNIDMAIALGCIPVIYGHNVKSDADALADGYVNVIGLTVYTHIINRLSGLNVNAMTMLDWYNLYS